MLADTTDDEHENRHRTTKCKERPKGIRREFTPLYTVNSLITKHGNLITKIYHIPSA